MAQSLVGALPPGAVTLDQLISSHDVSTPRTTLRRVLEPAVIGAHHPAGTRCTMLVYDEAAACALLARVRPSTRSRPTRARQRNASTPVPYGLPAGWRALTDIAAESRMSVARLRRAIARRGADIGNAEQRFGVGVVEALRIFLSATGDEATLWERPRVERRIHGARARWTCDRATSDAGAATLPRFEHSWANVWRDAARLWVPSEASEDERGAVADTMRAALAEPRAWRSLTGVTVVNLLLGEFQAAHRTCVRSMAVRRLTPVARTLAMRLSAGDVEARAALARLAAGSRSRSLDDEGRLTLFLAVVELASLTRVPTSIVLAALERAPTLGRALVALEERLDANDDVDAAAAERALRRQLALMVRANGR